MTKVVLVDDERDIVEVTTLLLESSEIDVVGVGYDGKQAVELCSKHNPDFLILDLTMPKFDGFYALEKLQNSKIKIIVLTGVVDKDILKKLEPYSPFTIRRKPLEFDEILNILNNLEV